MKSRLSLVCLPLLATLGCGGATPSSAKAPTEGTSTAGSKLLTVLSGAQRTEKERARDQYRHPRETLEFFGVREDMNVVELSAGQGWYTAVLGPLLNPKGKLAVTTADPNGPADGEGTKNAKVLAERLSKRSLLLRQGHHGSRRLEQGRLARPR